MCSLRKTSSPLLASISSSANENKDTSHIEVLFSLKWHIESTYQKRANK